MESLLQALTEENAKLKNHNKILSSQISIALEGFEVLVSMGDIAGNVAKQTLDEMEKCEKELPHNPNTKED